MNKGNDLGWRQTVIGVSRSPRYCGKKKIKPPFFIFKSVKDQFF